MEFPRSKIAACPIFYGAQGGQFNEFGKIVRTQEDDPSVLCGRAFDCGHCSFLQDWIRVKEAQGFEWGWECVTCLNFSKRFDHESGTERLLTGYYQAGRKPSLDPNSLDADPDMPGIDGCTHILEADNQATGQVAGQVCGWETSFLQLVLRRRIVRRQPVPASAG